MKKKLLTILLIAFGALSAFAQFTAGNLAVYRYGDGASAMVNGARVPVFVDEYTPTGTFVKTITIPRTASGGNYGFEGLGRTSGGGYQIEGFPTLSKNGATFTIIGYNPASSTSLVVGTLNAAGTWSATTLTDDLGVPRSAVVNGTAVYFNGADFGVRYKTLGTTSASTRVSDISFLRVLTIAEVNYNGSVLAKIFAPEGNTNLSQAGLVTTLTTFSDNSSSTPPVPTVPSANPLVSAHQVVVFRTTNNRTLIYVLDDNSGSPVIKKYRSDATAANWVALGSIPVPFNTKSIAGVYRSATGVNLYYTTWDNPSAGGDSQLYSFSDNFTTSTEASTSISGSGTLIATAPANTTFRGVTMAPGTTLLPVDLTAFNANEKNGTIRLNWSTASETNNAHFEVLRSSTASNFVKIGQVAAKGNGTGASYAFVDEKPLPGTNYYQLKQVDLDGKSETFGPVSAVIPVAKTNFDIVKTTTGLALQVYAAQAQSGVVELSDVNGKVNHRQSISLEKGSNRVVLNGNFNRGLVIVTLKTSDAKIAKKTVL